MYDKRCICSGVLVRVNLISTVKSVWNDHPRCQEELIFLESWSFLTGSGYMELNGRKTFSETANGLSRQGGLSRGGRSRQVLLYLVMICCKVLVSIKFRLVFSVFIRLYCK